MLRSVILLAVLLSCLPLEAQDLFETTYREGFFTSAAVIESYPNGDMIQTGRYYVAGGWGSSQVFLRRVSSEGELLWITDVPNSYFQVTEDVNIRMLFPLEDGSTLFIGTASGCDFLGGDFIGSIAADGTINYINDYFDGQFFAQEGSLWQNETVLIAGFSQETFEVVDQQGETLDAFSSSLTYAYDFDTNLEAQRIAACGNSASGKKLEIIDEEGTGLASLAIDDYGPVIFDNSLNVLYYSGTRLYKYNSSLELLASSEEIDGVTYSASIYANGDYYYLIARKPFVDGIAPAQRILVLDQDLQIVQILNMPEHRSAAGMAFTGDAVALSLNERNFAALKTTNPLLESDEPIRDLSITYLNIGQVDSVFSNCESLPIYDYSLEDITMRITNLGEEAINYFEVNALYNNECFAICYDSFPTFEAYDEQSIEPGASVLINFPNLNLPVQNAPLQLRFYPSRPNRHLDWDHSNDLNLDAGTSLENLKSASVSIWPNPVTDDLHIEILDQVGKDFNIRDLLGARVLQGQLSPGHTRVSTDLLPSGLYFLKISGEAEVLKFMKH